MLRPFIAALAALSVTCAAPKPPPKAVPDAANGTFEPSGTMARADIDDTYKWDLAGLFESPEAFEGAFAEAEKGRERLRGFAGRLSDATVLRVCLETYFATRLLTNRLTLYASMRLDTHLTDTAMQAANDRALAAMKALIAESGFIRSEVLALDEAAMKTAYDKEPELTQYRPYLDGLRRRKDRVLSVEAERVLALAGDNLWAEIDLNELPSDHEKTFGALLNDISLPTIRDESGEEVQLTLSSYGKYRGSSDRRVRRDTVEGFFARLQQYRHALAATLAGQINFTIFLARARGYDTALAAYFDKDAIDPTVYTSVIEAVRANVAPLHDYVRLRKEVMGIDDLHLYDLYTPMVRAAEKKITFEEASEILPAALAPLGEKYLEVLREGLDPKNGWIDVYPHEGKESGAFSAAVYGSHPFVKMNYFDRFDDLSTLAHEYGHAVHSFLSWKTQPYITFNYAPFIAEIASTTNEKLLSDYLLSQAKTDEERLSILNEVIETIRTTVFRQALFAEFELRAHTAAQEGTPLTAEWLNDTYRDLIAHYYGPDFTIGENDGIEWAYVPHFYYKFYVLSYATGLSSGIALAERIQAGGEREREDFLGMLRGGSSKPPLELLRGAGVDLTRPDAVVAATQVMQRSIQQMREILARRR